MFVRQKNLRETFAVAAGATLGAMAVGFTPKTVFIIDALSAIMTLAVSCLGDYKRSRDASKNAKDDQPSPPPSLG